MFDEPMVTLRLLHYSSEKSNANQGLYAAGQHSDYGMLTFLALDDQPGLQIYTDGEWKVRSVQLFLPEEKLIAPCVCGCLAISASCFESVAVHAPIRFSFVLVVSQLVLESNRMLSL